MMSLFARLVPLAFAAALLSTTALPAAAQKVLNVGMAAADVGLLDPHRAATTQDKPVVGYIFSGLVRFKPGTMSIEQIEPDLAESWTASPDKLTWTFKLRRGVKFHNGFGELTADDVVFSLKRAADAKSSAFSSDFASFAEINAVDPLTVEIKLKENVPSLLGLLTNYQGGNIVSRKAVEQYGDDFRVKPVGTGPFAFSEYKPKEAVVLVANKDYFRGAPKIDKINYRYIPADASRDLAFQSGELDLVYGRQDQKWVERLKGMDKTIVDVFQPAELSILHLNMTSKPLDDIRVRQAIAHALDRDQLVQFKGALVTVAGKSVVPIGYLGSDDTIELPKYDIAKAKELLTAAGYPNGITIKTIQTSLPVMLTSMQIVQAQLKKAGIDLQLEVVDHPTFHAQIRKDLSQTVYYAAARFPVADIYLTQFFHSRSIVGTPTAVTNFSHCDVADAEIDAARKEVDPAKQKELWKTAQRKIMDKLCAVPLFEQLQVWARKSTVDYGYKLEGALMLGPLITETTTIQ